MYNTTDGKKQYLKLQVINSIVTVLTNIILINRDKSNLNNLKVSFIKDEDYDNKVPYMYLDETGEYTFLRYAPSCNILTVLLTINNEVQYETSIVSGEFYVISTDPADAEINVAINKVITIDMNEAYLPSDLIDTKVWLETLTDPLTMDTTTWTMDRTDITMDATEL